MITTTCAICDTSAADQEVYSDTLGVNAATSERFSARRTPDRVHYRMVRCRNCGLLRSDPILADDELLQLYRNSALTYEGEAAFARRILNIEEKRPRLAVAVFHGALGLESDEDVINMSGLKKALAAHGWEGRDIILKKFDEGTRTRLDYLPSDDRPDHNVAANEFSTLLKGKLAPDRLWLNSGNAVFADASAQLPANSGGFGSGRVRFADLDEDGDLDVWVVDQGHLRGQGEGAVAVVDGQRQPGRQAEQIERARAPPVVAQRPEERQRRPE